MCQLRLVRAFMPGGRFYGGNGVAELLAAVSRREKRHIVELVCAHHPAAEKGPPQSDLVVRSRSCLAALGPSAMMSLLALGVYHVLLRVDACRACPIGQVRAAINKSVFQAESLLVTGHGSGSPLTLLDNVREDWPARPVVRGNLPTQSRRDFFRSFMGPQELSPTARRLMLEEQPEGDKYPPAERRRLLQALAVLAADILATEPLHEFGLSMISAADNCNACRICERACPTAAMQFEVDEEDNYRLSFSAGACTECGVCINLCEPGALQRERTPRLADWLAVEPVILHSGQLRRCLRCGAGFAGDMQSDLCPVCDFRRKNPFGSRLPPAVAESGQTGAK